MLQRRLCELQRRLCVCVCGALHISGPWRLLPCTRTRTGATPERNSGHAARQNAPRLHAGAQQRPCGAARPNAPRQASSGRAVPGSSVAPAQRCATASQRRKLVLQLRERKPVVALQAEHPRVVAVGELRIKVDVCALLVRLRAGVRLPVFVPAKPLPRRLVEPAPLLVPLMKRVLVFCALSLRGTAAGVAEPARKIPKHRYSVVTGGWWPATEAAHRSEHVSTWAGLRTAFRSSWPSTGGATVSLGHAQTARSAKPWPGTPALAAQPARANCASAWPSVTALAAPPGQPGACLRPVAPAHFGKR